MLNPNTDTNYQAQPESILNWFADAPKAGSAVMRRILQHFPLNLNRGE
jgi:hypothetical protein